MFHPERLKRVHKSRAEDHRRAIFHYALKGGEEEQASKGCFFWKHNEREGM